MRTAPALRALAVTTLLTAACGAVNPLAGHDVSTPPAAMSVQPTVASAPPTVSPPTPSPTPTPTPRPVPSPVYLAAQCMAPSGRRLVLVTLRGSDHIVVRDITDISHPTTVSNLRTYPAPVGASTAMEGAIGQFVCETEVSFVGGADGDFYGLPTNLFRAPLSGSSKLVINGNEVFVFAWGRDGGTLLYVTPAPGEEGFARLDLHELRGGVDRVIGSMPPMGVGGCETSPCPGPFQDPGDKWDFRLSYSSDEAFISVVYSGIRSFLRVWSSAGKLLGSSDGLETNMSVWSGANLYFRDAMGIEMWHNGTISTFLPGVAWIRPKASPAGGQILYETRDAQRLTHISIVDTVTRKVTELASGRSEPACLTSQFIWYQAEPACESTGKCDSGFPGIASGSTYIYDLVSGTESGSVITSVIDGWPRGA